MNPISVSPTKPDERVVYGVEEETAEQKREKRRKRDEMYPLESVRWLSEEAKKEFRDTMIERGVAAESD